LFLQILIVVQKKVTQVGCPVVSENDPNCQAVMALVLVKAIVMSTTTTVVLEIAVIVA
jgi:hypothetical protein